MMERVALSAGRCGSECVEYSGIPSSVAINMFYNQIILNNGLPFDVKIPSNKILNEDDLTIALFGYSTHL